MRYATSFLVLLVSASSPAASAQGCPPPAGVVEEPSLGKVVLHGTQLGLVDGSALITVRFLNPGTGEPGESVKAQLDTGSDNSYVKSRFVPKSGLPYAWTRRVAGGPADAGAIVRFYYSTVAWGLDGRASATVGVDDAIGPDAILGRGFLGHVVMTYDGPCGTVTVAAPSTP